MRTSLCFMPVAYTPQPCIETVDPRQIPIFPPFHYREYRGIRCGPRSCNHHVHFTSYLPTSYMVDEFSHAAVPHSLAMQRQCWNMHQQISSYHNSDSKIIASPSHLAFPRTTCTPSHHNGPFSLASSHPLQADLTDHLTRSALATRALETKPCDPY